MHMAAERYQNHSVQPTAGCQRELASIWIPWLAAPLFAFLPLAGCWLAGFLHQPHRQTVQHRQADRSVTPITMASFVGVAQPR
jgi:hypothetical protein